MRVINITEQQQERITGRLSDGSDHQRTTDTVWVVHAVDALGREHELQFRQSPTDQDIIDALPRPRRLLPTRRQDLIDAIEERASAWLGVKLLIDAMEQQGDLTALQISRARQLVEAAMRQQARLAVLAAIQAPE